MKNQDQYYQRVELNTPEDIQYLKKCGADAFLIGSSIMKSDNIEEQSRKLVNAY